MDQQKLRTLVFEKTGVRIDIDDPIFALVALNEAVLAEAVERHVALLDEATASLAAQLRQGGVALSAAAATPAPGPALPPAPQERRLAAIAGAAALLCALLVLGGQALLFRPGPVPAPVLVAKELTPEQSAALRERDKLARIIQKLDAKTRNTIQAELQKP